MSRRTFYSRPFSCSSPVANLPEKYVNLIENIHREEFVDDFLHMETWLNDNISVPGEVYREFAKYLFQQNQLVKNRLPLDRHTVDLRKITCPLLNLMASSDHLVPCSQTDPLNDLVSSTDKDKIVWPAGHIGLAVGTKAQKELWPRAVDWLLQRTD
jgi:polyhydroxyalkanoate synthase